MIGKSFSFDYSLWSDIVDRRNPISSICVYKAHDYVELIFE
jgi:hypothetical protein